MCETWFKEFIVRFACQHGRVVPQRVVHIDAHFYPWGRLGESCGAYGQPVSLQEGKVLRPRYNPLFRLKFFVYQPNACPLNLGHPRCSEPAGHS